MPTPSPGPQLNAEGLKPYTPPTAPFYQNELFFKIFTITISLALVTLFLWDLWCHRNKRTGRILICCALIWPISVVLVQETFNVLRLGEDEYFLLCFGPVFASWLFTIAYRWVRSAPE